MQLHLWFLKCEITGQSCSSMAEKRDALTKLASVKRQRVEFGETTGTQASSSYRKMLVEVGDELTNADIDKLANLANLTTGEKDRRLKGNGDERSLKLFEILEEKGKIKEDDVSWLYDNLKTIKKENAAQIVLNYEPTTDRDGFVPSEPEWSDSDDNEENSTSFDLFLNKIGLKGEFPQKISLERFLRVREMIKDDTFVDLFWQKLTLLDFRAGLLEPIVSKGLSMRDFIFGVLHCADNFLRQDILEKMSACQLAVPVVLQCALKGTKPQFLLWALRRIRKKWKGDGDSLALEQPICSYPVFTVFVTRVGDIPISKSELLNTLLGHNQGGSSHSYFLQRVIDNMEPVFSKGSIECTWFLPSWSNSNETLRTVTAIFNLRGDCRDFLDQTRFACKAADLTIALIANSQRENNCDQIRLIRRFSTKTLFISVKKEEVELHKSQKVKPKQYKEDWLFVKLVPLHILGQEISCKINELSGDKTRYKKLEHLVMFCGENIQVDEDNFECKEAKRVVSKFFDEVDTSDIIALKENIFPLQTIWKEWVNIDKAQIVADAELSFEHQRSKMLENKRNKRKLQIENHLSKTMKQYQDVLDKFQTNKAILQYLLSFLQDMIYHMVNENTQQDMQCIVNLEEQMRQWKADRAAGETSVNDDEVVGECQARKESHFEILKTECNILHQKCRDKNLGCEHFMRELGQLYEAYAELTPKDTEYKGTVSVALLPTLAACMLTEMHSFELLDGDTGRVPLTWVMSVLDALINVLEDPDARVLVVSVIGVQSSGKSTLLNSMFGVRFPVRAGRCTRGVFIRLVPVKDNLAKELGLKYFVIVDTEGIRSVDHDDCRFDNELVTFALSISNVTIFNIEGENVGPDMTGILQVAAHALMRMKEVDLECHCRIVQQRVSDLTAGDRNKANTNRIMQTLDESIIIAAQEEGLEGRYRCFADVVDLQVDQNFQYIPCLWTGGMSPPNFMYSERVDDFKAKLLKDIRNGRVECSLNLTTFSKRVRDVWRAVREENFVFNFHDSVKAVDFNKLCLEFNKWTLQTRQEIINFTNTFLASVGELTTKDIQYPNFDTLKEKIQEQDEKLKKHLNNYMENHQRKPAILKHKKGFVDSIGIVLKDIQYQAITKLTHEFEVHNVKLSLPKLERKWREQLTKESKKLALSLLHSATTSRNYANSDFEDFVFFQLRTEFVSNWIKWQEKMKLDIPKTDTQFSEVSLKKFCERELLTMTRDMAIGSEIQSLLLKEGGLDKHSKPIDTSKYINLKFYKSWIKETKVSSEQQQTKRIQRYDNQILNDLKEKASHVVNEVVNRNLEHLQNQQKKGSFDKNIFQLMMQSTLEEFSSRSSFKLPLSLVAKGLLHACSRAEVYLCNMAKSSGVQFGYLMLKERDEIWEEFVSFYRYNDHTSKAASFISYFIASNMNLTSTSILELTSVVKRVDLPWDLLHYFEDDEIALFEHLVEHQTWQDLADLYLKEHLQALSLSLHSNVERKINYVLDDALRTINNRFQKLFPTATWEDLCNDLGDDFHCVHIKSAATLFNVCNLTDFYNELKASLTRRKGNAMNEQTKGLFEGNAYSLYKSLTGLSYLCEEVCPMCKAPCDNRLEGHRTHFSLLHRPRGLSGETYPGTFTLVLEDCPSSITYKTTTFTHYNKTYFCQNFKTDFPNWEIHPSTDDPGKLFWQWNFAQEANEIAALYNCNSPDIPESWSQITKTEAYEALERDKKLKTEFRSINKPF